MEQETTDVDKLNDIDGKIQNLRNSLQSQEHNLLTAVKVIRYYSACMDTAYCMIMHVVLFFH